jgi:hypothetical protein
MYSRFTPTYFGKWLPSAEGRRCLGITQVISVLWAYTDYDPSSVASYRGIPRIILLGILIFKGLTVRRLYKSFGVKGLKQHSIHFILFGFIGN